MQRITEIIDITPHQTLMPKLGKSGYNIPQAIAELVDNAIDARIEARPLRVAVKIGKNEISVADDGAGMDRDEIADAMVLGKSSKKAQLGEFGLGLKTSCTNLGRKFRVVTSKEGHPFEYSIEYDEDTWLTAEDSWKLQLGIDKAEPGKHYTIVQISKLNKYYGGVVDVVIRDLQQRFAPFISDGSVVLTVNQTTCVPETFDILDDTRTDFAITDKRGNRIYGWHGLLKQGSNKGLYGFHTYRLGRMITTYDKIAIGEHRPSRVSLVRFTLTMCRLPTISGSSTGTRSSTRPRWKLSGSSYKSCFAKPDVARQPTRSQKRSRTKWSGGRTLSPAPSRRVS